MRYSVIQLLCSCPKIQYMETVELICTDGAGGWAEGMLMNRMRCSRSRESYLARRTPDLKNFKEQDLNLGGKLMLNPIVADL